MNKCVAGAREDRRLRCAAQPTAVVRRQPGPLAVAPLFACLLLLGTAAAGKLPRRLVNREYGLSVGVPPGAVGCVKGLHGFSILLHPRTRGCGSQAPQDYVGLYGDYNSAFYPTPAKSLAGLCPHGAALAAVKGRGLRFPGRPSAECRREERNGWEDIFVAAQAGTQPKGFGLRRSVPLIDYTAQLHVRAQRLARGLAAFRKILRSVRIQAPRPPSAHRTPPVPAGEGRPGYAKSAGSSAGSKFLSTTTWRVSPVASSWPSAARTTS